MQIFKTSVTLKQHESIFNTCFFYSIEYAIIQPNDVFIESEVYRPRRTGGLSLFFRKVYNLAYVRLEHLCNGCGLKDEILKRKIWTTFEKALKDHTNLFKDRHLDQNIMCCVYIVWKKANLVNRVKDENLFRKIINQVGT